MTNSSLDHTTLPSINRGPSLQIDATQTRPLNFSEFALTGAVRGAVVHSLRKGRQTPGAGLSEPIRAGKKRKSDLKQSLDLGTIPARRSPRLTSKIEIIPDPSDNLRVGPAPSLDSIAAGSYRRLDPSFYDCDALELAPKLLGKLIRRDDVILKITEVEAYRPNDTACHARVGKTARTEPLFGPAGHAYVYLCYGLHSMLNVVADRVDVGAAVLIRACSPVAGMTTIQARRGQASEKPVLLTGPGKVGQALGLTTEWTNHPLYKEGGLEILDAPPPDGVLVGPRVGIDYAKPCDIAAPWRFAVADTPWVSAPRSTLKAAGEE